MNHLPSCCHKSTWLGPHTDTKLIKQRAIPPLDRWSPGDVDSAVMNAAITACGEVEHFEDFFPYLPGPGVRVCFVFFPGKHILPW